MFKSFFKSSTSERRNTKTPRARSLRLESLENRELLSVAPWDAAAEPASEAAVVATVEAISSVDLSSLSASASNPTSATASYVVTTNLDVVDANDGVLSLREAISAAQTGETITFASSLKGKTIALADSQLLISKGVVVDASSLCDAESQAPGLTIDGDGFARVFYLTGGTSERPIELIGLTVTGGNAEFGGGVCVDAGANVAMTNCEIAGNYAYYGGGLRSEGTTTLTDCVVADNVARSYNGGGILTGGGTTTLINCEISGNSATYYGGGIFASVGVVNAIDCVISDNEAGYGGGLSVSTGAFGGFGAVYELPTNVAFVNVEISGNTAKYGGGVYLGALDDGDTTSNFRNCTIVGNRASSNGDGVFGQLESGVASATFYNSIVLLNGANDVALGNKVAINAYNTLSTYAAWNNAGASGVVNYSYNSSQPLFKDAENGDYYLAKDSQALNKGNNSFAVNLGGAALTTDLTGNSRFVGTVDLGAYERQTTTRLSAPTLTAEAVDSHTIAITIGASANASGYVVEYTSKNSGFESGYTSTADFDEAGVARISGLTSYTRYWFRVKAVGDGTFYDDSAWSATKNARTPDEMKPDLAPYVPDGWSDSLVVSTTPGSTVDAEVIGSNDNVYVSSAYYNIGTAVAAPHVIGYELYNAKGEMIASLTSTQESELPPRYYAFISSEATNFGKLAPGVYTIRTKLDYLNNVDEWIEGNNVYEKTFVVSAVPTISVETRGVSGLTATLGYVANASGYTVQYSVDPTFPNDETLTFERTFSSSGVKKLSNLTPNTTYYVRAKVGENGVWSDVVSASTAPIRCATPTLTIAQRDKTSQTHTVTIGFSSGASSYTMEYSTDPTFATYSTKTYTSNGAKKFADFPSDATVYVRVKAEGEGSYVDSSYSSSILVLGTPTFELAQRGTDETALSVTLGYVAGATKYVVDYSTDATFSTYSTREYSSNGTKKLSGLQPGTTYYARVTACDGTNSVESWVSTTKSETTPCNQLATPTFTVVSREAGSLSITIDKVAGATGYAARYSTDGATWRTATFTTSGTHKLTGLNANALYRVCVQATRGGNGDSDWSAERSAITVAGRLAVPTLMVAGRDATSFTVTIGAVANASSYTLEYALDEAFTVFWTRDFSTSGARTIADLEANQNYYFRVKANGSNGYGDSNWSSAFVGNASEATSRSTLTDEVFASPFDDLDFFDEDDENDFFAF